MAVLNVHHFGDPDGEPILAAQGIPAPGRGFRRLAEEAMPHRRTVAVDLRGHGRSLYDGPWSIPQHVRDLLDTLDALEIDQADLVAHSYGGTIGLAVLAVAPQRVRRFVMLDPALELPAAISSPAAMGTIDDP